MTTKDTSTNSKLVDSSSASSPAFPAVNEAASEKLDNQHGDNAGLFGEVGDEEGGQALVSSPPFLLLDPTTVVGDHSRVNNDEEVPPPSEETNTHSESGERWNEENDVEVAVLEDDGPIIAELVDHHETNHIPHVIAEPAPDEQEIEEKRKESERKLKARLFRRYCIASIVLIAGASVAMGLLVTNKPSENQSPANVSLGDGKLCTSSSECNEEAENQSIDNSWLGDWELCTLSSECESRCCSYEFSQTDGLLKCTPLDETSIIMCLTDESTVLNDWDFCSHSVQCKNHCCSKTYSIGNGYLRCTPVGGFDPAICVTGRSGPNF